VSSEKWFRSPVTSYKGRMSELRELLPVFERQPFGVFQPTSSSPRSNEYLDAIVRRAMPEDPEPVPVGVVSKSYVLVQHTEVVDAAIDALKVQGIPPESVEAELKMTAYGERIALSIYLPTKYHFIPLDENPLALRVECWNSVDASTRFIILMGWFRFVCENGLIIGVTSLDLHRRHIGDLGLEDFAYFLRSGLRASLEDKENLNRWQGIGVSIHQLATWADDTVRKAWGFKAAARAYHIARCGKDVEIIGAYQGALPSRISVRETVRVPGQPKCCDNKFHVSQVLAWLAKERRDMQEQLERRHEIPALLRPLDTADARENT
jgi:hypothetical protein